MTGKWRRACAPRGQALVEFALVLPIFLMLVFGLLDLGRVVYINNSLSEAARDGARWGSVQARSADSAGRTQIANEAAGKMTAVPNPTVAVSCERDGSTVSSCHTNDTLVVQVSATVELVTPILNRFLGPFNLSATAEVAVNQ